MIAVVVVGTFVITMLLGFPVFFVLAITSLVYMLLSNIGPWMMVQQIFVGLDVFVIMAVPFFIFAGNLMYRGGTLRRLIAFANCLVGHLTAGLAHVNVVASVFFSGITGAATADVAALGPLVIRMMTAAGYRKDYATAVTIASATVGPIFPPSLPLVIYGVVAGVSIGGLFFAGILPALVLAAVLILANIYFARIEKVPRTDRASVKELGSAFAKAVGPLGLPLIILAGIYTGVFTPTEAAAVACLYAFILGKFVYKELHWREMPGLIYDTAVTAAAAGLIVGIAAAFSWIVSYENIPRLMTEYILTISDNKIVILLIANVALLVIGCFIEAVSAIIIVAPVLVPALAELGISPIHFGIVMVVNLTIGLVTPPLGLSLYISSAITGLSIERIARAVLGYFLVLLIGLLIITLIPEISLLLPRVLLGLG